MTRVGQAERERLGELLERTLAIPPAGRAAFLEDACGGDTRLYEELRSLLASHAEAPDFLSQIENALFPAVTGVLSDPFLATGTAIGRYEIIESLGSGGMGVVYKARDPTLDRLVALKLLPSHLSADASARARLKREARAASSLDHPNIAVVYEIGETESAPGHPERGGVFIAMAYCEGETLKDRIARGRLSIREALDYGIQLADALSRAHGAGIVHRDIKPANVMVTESDQIKIVDFGVAKSAGSTATGETVKPDVVEPGADLTRDGTRFGTVTYMSPEQTRGAAVDHRTDLWSLGVVLYEMLAGVRPFRGAAENAIVYAIRSENPAPLNSVRPEAPSGLARVVDRCLAKDPAARYASAAAVLADLRALAVEAAVDDTEPSSVARVEQAVAAVPASSRAAGRNRSRARAAAIVAFAAVAGAGIVEIAAVARRGGDPLSIVRSAAPLSPATEGTLFATGVSAGPIAFHSFRDDEFEGEIYTLDVNELRPKNITNHPAGDYEPDWSPDGGRILFLSYRDGDGDIYTMYADGTRVTRLTFAPGYDGHAAWSPDGKHVAFTSLRDGNAEIYVMNADGSDHVRLTHDPARDLLPSWSSDGKHIVFASYRDGNANIYVMNSVGTGLRRLSDHPAHDLDPAWSPDGTSIAFTSFRDGNAEIYLMNVDGTGLTNLTRHPANDYLPDWSLDGHHIAFTSERTSGGDIYVMNTDGTAVTRLTTSPELDDRADWGK